MTGIVGVAIHGREALPRRLLPFVADTALTLQAYVRFAGPMRTTFIVGEAAKSIAGESPRIAVLEVDDAGTLYFSFRIDWADALRGWWAGVGSIHDDRPIEPSSLVRSSDAEDRWIDPAELSPALQRAHLLTLARVAEERRLNRRGAGSAEDTRLLARAASSLESPGVHLRHARALEAEGRFAESLAVLESIASAFEDGAAHDRARALLGLDRPREALEVLDALVVNATASMALVRGQVLTALSRHDEALSSFRDASTLPRSSYEACVFGLPLSAVEREVETLYRLARYEEAIVAVAPLFSARARLLHGRCYEGLARWNEAVAQYEKARELGEPAAVTALLELGRKRSLLTQKPTLPQDGSIDVGWTVSHPKLGTGTVLDVEDGATTRVLVALERGGEKWLPAAQLRVLTKA